MSHDFIQILKERGFVHQMTDEDGLRNLLASGPQKAYVGYDCTGPSLHVGHLLPTMALRWFQKCGHTPVVLLGGGTTKIGDPSGKDEARKMLTVETIADNMASISTAFSRLLSTDGTNAYMPVNNADWLDKLNYIEMLREIAPHFSVNRMLTMDSVKLRLERDQPLSFLEFNYMILQAYDFYQLHKVHDVRLQMGGSDQWGNIIQGVELGRRMNPAPKPGMSGVDLGGSEAQAQQNIRSHLEHEKKYSLFGLTTPLITTASGAKMGKTASGAVWLNADLLSPYDYWQFWRNTEDGDVIRFLKLFTELPLEQIAEYETWLGSAKINDAKIILATEATALLHGRAAADKSAATAAETFSGSGVSEDLPEITITAAQVEAGIAVYELLVLAGFAASNGEARRLIKGNGIKISDKVIESDDAKIKFTDGKWSLIRTREIQVTPVVQNRSPIDLGNDDFIKLSKGKKQHVLVKIS